jgi:serine/threonine-protein kinase
VAVHIALDAARALQYLHERDYVHRDIKPDNILLSRAGSAKIADLWLLKRRHDPLPRRTIVQGIGTSVYMPPEQAANASLVDGRSDLYALGATLYQLLTGEVPFPGDDHQAIIRSKEGGDFIPASRFSPDLPAVLDGLLARLLAPRPADRPGSAATLIAELESSGLAAPPASCPAVAEILEAALESPSLEADGERTRSEGEPLAATPPEGGWYPRSPRT